MISSTLTPLSAEPVYGAEPWSSSEQNCAASERTLLSGLSKLTVRLQQVYPSASPEVIRWCVEGAARDFGDARVQHYLLILIERRARDVLREMLCLASSATRIVNRPVASNDDRVVVPSEAWNLA